MTDSVISIAAKVAECLVNPTIRLGEYLFCARKITQDLLRKKEELVLEKDKIQRRIDEVTRKTEIVEDDVKTWMDNVTNVLQQVEPLECEMEANKCCYQGWCPTWRRYRLCKQMEEMIKIITEYKNNSQFHPFSHLAPLPSIEYESSKDFTYFESTKLAYNQLFEALQDDKTCVIGLYGMGGCGKTTLVTEVGKKAKELKLFDQVVSVTVSQTPDIRSMQGKMADMLGLKLEEESNEGRAQRLSLGMKKKSVLIIVDDVWSNFNLKDIGIEFSKSNKRSHKVLLTTRRRQICISMDCGWKIPLLLLSEKEAWDLFKNFAAMDDQSSFSMIECVAKEVAGECKGLPIAIKAMASSLKGKLNDFYEWKVALQKLKDSKPIDVEGGERDAFSCLKLSYDYLRDKEAELLFFMCAMFPEDCKIPVEDLIRYGVGLGVCGEFESFDLARSKIKVSLNKLLDSCLLEETSEVRASFKDHFGRGYVKMHDMVRDLALWMASKVDHTIKVNLVKDVNSLLGVTEAKNCFTISLQHRKFQETCHQVDAPKLEVLILNNWKSLHLSHVSFEGMRGLKVLAIINRPYFVISLLPQSIESLSNLQTLRLYGWKLGDMFFIVSLSRLVVLVLQNCRFKEVPDGIEKLSKLKLLDLTDCWIEENYNLKMIERCSQLEELYVFGERSLNFLQCCAHYAIAPNLQRYKLRKEAQFDFEYIATEPFAKRTLCLERLNDLPILGGCKNIVPDMEQVVGGLADLTELCLKSCFEVEYLIDKTSELGGSFEENALFDRLIKLELEEMRNLKEVCHGAPPATFLKCLTEFHITNCQQMHSIFPPQCNLCNLKILNIWGQKDSDEGTNCAAVGLFSMSVARSLQQLEELIVECCPELRHIIANVEADNTHSRGGEISHTLSNFYPLFSSLKKLRVCNCPKLEFIFPISCVGQDGLVQLQEINVLNAGEMKYVFGEYDYGRDLSHENKIHIMLPHLYVFKLNNLENLLGIFPDKYRTRWPSLRELSWQNCPKLATPWINLEVGRQKHLTKFQAPESSVIFFGPTATCTLNFQYLQSLELVGFTTLKSIFSMVVLISLSELKSLKICNCEELIEIIADNEEHSDLMQVEVCLPKLETLVINQCNQLKSLFCLDMIKSLPQLKTLCISEASELKEIFRQSSDDNTVIEEESMLPNLSSIALEELPNFVDIYQGFMFHKLEVQNVHIGRCPKFTPILGAIQVIPLHHRTEEKTRVWDIATNANQLGSQEMLPATLQAFLNIEVLSLAKCSIEGILKLQVGSKNARQSSLKSDLQLLFLAQLPELRYIWGGNITVLEFHRLDFVHVVECPRLKTIFPPGIAGSLQSLRMLWISECEELEEIIASSDLQQMCFPQLMDINIKRCDKLKCIFSDYMPRHFPLLSSVQIEECCEIERIFGRTRAADEDEAVVLMELSTLQLFRLPNFTEIGHGIQLRTKPYTYEVDDCPQIHTPIYLYNDHLEWILDDVCNRVQRGPVAYHSTSFSGDFMLGAGHFQRALGTKKPNHHRITE